ncbi:uncharacterized protein B0H18DRAFT_172445 [Fomitopsis serialis]|uniref:uncharacterized protein n=1 Tax=Fomitopsis serialis TaxID=139415 RepID=UPI002007EBBA|nr:uncharacterized protein B0H18DRAFT_172445 [Neoantrodia serialis]KAH9929718.1 hypothetical protein B0H18DRAFT_172445 [Neoantrodia serialis]
MLNLSNLRNLLSQVLALPELHTVALFTPEGQLVSFAADPHRPKDNVRVIVGLGGEVWKETRQQDAGMVDTEVRRVVVLPIDEEQYDDDATENGTGDKDPVMLLALNSTSSVSWEELELKARELAKHLRKPVSELRGRLAAAPVLHVGPRPERTAR